MNIEFYEYRKFLNSNTDSNHLNFRKINIRSWKYKFTEIFKQYLIRKKSWWNFNDLYKENIMGYMY